MAIDVTEVKPITTESISPQLLRPHPRNIEIYGRENVDDLKQRISSSNWIKPLVITQHNVIISGHRRWQAACELNRTSVPVERRIFANEIDALEALLLENASRDKTTHQKVGEGKSWEYIYKARAEQKQKDQGSQGVLGKEHGSEGKEYGSEGGRGKKKDKPPLEEPDPQGGVKETPKKSNTTKKRAPQTRDQVAQQVGLGSGKNYENGKKASDAIDTLKAKGHVEEAEALRQILNKSAKDAVSIAAMPEGTQVAVLAKIVADEKKKVKDAVKEVKQEKQQEEVKQIQQAAPPPEPAAVKELEVESGQTWRLGNHLLYCGDSSSAAFISLAKEHKASFAFADPPYNAGVAEWDKDFVWKHDYLLDLAPIVAVTPGISAIKDFMCVTKMDYKWSMSYWIDNGMTRGALGFGNWIYVALFSKGSIHRNSQDISRLSITNKDRDELEHKGRKPLDMMHHIVSLFSKDGEVVIDPFLGTGSTLIVCEQTGRRCIGAEINPDSCKYIIKWWENKSGKKAEVL